MPAFFLNLQLLNQQSQPLPNLSVQLWANEQKMGEALTDAEGRCIITIELPATGGRAPVLFGIVLVYDDETQIYGGADTTLYALEGTGLSVLLTIPYAVSTRRADRIPFRLAELRRPATAMDGLTGVQQNYVVNKLNTALQARVQRVLGETDSRLNEDPIALSLDYTSWLDSTLGDVLSKVVADNAGPRTFIEGSNLGERLAQNPRPVREILHLDLPLIQNPIFWEEVQVLRTTELTDILLPGYRDLPDQMLERAWDWERAAAEQWDALGLTEA
ncbi:MAG: hypothetical protein KDD02_12570, partial [Phaeodactylibacter sp.]|nr:hypothetical protein [Phaeodactylibacter sp.]